MHVRAQCTQLTRSCRVGDGVTFSKTYNFTTLPAVGSTETLKIGVTADLGERSV